MLELSQAIQQSLYANNVIGTELSPIKIECLLPMRTSGLGLANRLVNLSQAIKGASF